MKSILISIKPRFAAKILNGEKTIEIRKSYPHCELPIQVYIYCTKDKERLVDLRDDNFYLGVSERLNGKVVAKFTLNKVEMIRPIALGSFLKTSTLEHKEIIDKSCLTENEIKRYLTTMYGYAWHISNLEIFDRPLPLQPYFDLKRPPQSWQFIESEK